MLKNFFLGQIEVRKFLLCSSKEKSVRPTERDKTICDTKKSRASPLATYTIHVPVIAIVFDSKLCYTKPGRKYVGKSEIIHFEHSSFLASE